MAIGAQSPIMEMASALMLSPETSTALSSAGENGTGDGRAETILTEPGV